VWPSGTWLVFHITVTTAEMHHPLPHYAHIHCLVSINVQQASVDVSECHSFHMEEFSDTPLLHMHFHVRCHSVRLPLCCHLSRGNKMEYWLEGSTSTAIPPASASSVTGQHNKTRGITFGAPLVHYCIHYFIFQLLKSSIS